MSEENVHASRRAMLEAPGEVPLLLANLPPSQQQRRLAFAIIAVFLVGVFFTIPFAHTRLPRLDAWLPFYSTTIFITDIITAALLFSQFSIVRQRALQVLAMGYLFSALIVIPHNLSFPGLHAPEGLIGGGLQTTVWLYLAWHMASPLSVIFYEMAKGADDATSASERPARAEIGSGVAMVIAFVCAVIWFVTAQHDLLPAIYRDRASLAPLANVAAAVVALLCVIALALLWIRGSSVLDLWLMVTVCAWLLEITLQGLFLTDRFSLAWYLGRVYSIVAGSVVLIVLLSETTTLYAHLARTVMRQRREREGRQFAMDAMAATIAHEVNQPLGAIALYSQASLRFLAETPPNIGEVRAGLEHIVRDSVRGSEVIARLRAMFKKGDHERTWCNVNHLVQEVLGMLDVELRAQRVSVLPELREDLSLVLADRVQLQEVILNLIVNAIEAMRSVTNRACLLRIKSGVSDDARGILVTIQDSGTGIDE
jgi:signal transduction histidine kinase